MAAVTARTGDELAAIHPQCRPQRQGAHQR